MSDEFYIRNKEGGFLGNSWFWYAKNGYGYTAYILGAERFSKDAAEKMVKEDPEKWEMYSCDQVDERLHLIFDSQDRKNLGTDNPCGWPSGYATPNTRTDELVEMQAAIRELQERIEDMLKGDDAQAWKEARKALENTKKWCE